MAIDLLRRGVQPAQDLGRVATEVLEQEEHQQHHAEQGGHHLPQAPDQIGRMVSGFLSRPS
jgi:hypothetical protein